MEQSTRERALDVCHACMPYLHARMLRLAPVHACIPSSMARLKHAHVASPSKLTCLVSHGLDVYGCRGQVPLAEACCPVRATANAVLDLTFGYPQRRGGKGKVGGMRKVSGRDTFVLCLIWCGVADGMKHADGACIR